MFAPASRLLQVSRVCVGVRCAPIRTSRAAHHHHGRWLSSLTSDETSKKVDEPVTLVVDDVSEVVPSEEETNELAKNLKPNQIVAALDKHIVGQPDAKRAVAIAMRNRWRRRQLPEDLRKEVTPRNVLLVGPTGTICF